MYIWCPLVSQTRRDLHATLEDSICGPVLNFSYLFLHCTEFSHPLQPACFKTQIYFWILTHTYLLPFPSTKLVCNVFMSTLRRAGVIQQWWAALFRVLCVRVGLKADDSKSPGNNILNNEWTPPPHELWCLQLRHRCNIIGRVVWTWLGSFRGRWFGLLSVGGLPLLPIGYIVCSLLQAFVTKYLDHQVPWFQYGRLRMHGFKPHRPFPVFCTYCRQKFVFRGKNV